MRKRRPVKVVDGSGLSMPDTEENQKEFPQSRRQKEGCGFPTMRIVALVSTMLYYMSRSALPDRPNRTEPRALKRRKKNYQLLNKPRRDFKEIPHRNKYKAGLS